jgi:hypothetical protein
MDLIWLVFSGSHINKVWEYIRTHKEHHRKKSWEEEYNELISGCGLTNGRAKAQG